MLKSLLQLSGKTILIAEDNEANGLLYKIILEKKYSLIFAHNGKEAVEKAISFKPNLIIMDINMPLMNGERALVNIRKNDILKNVPIIAVTSYAMKGDKSRLLSMGFNEYMSKPIDYKKLMFVIDLLL